MVDIVANKKTFDIGRFQENEYRRVVFDVSDVIRQYPDATFVVLNKRSGDDEAYPVPPERVTVEGGKLYWILSSADVSYDGYGQCAVTAYSGTVVAKSMRYNVRVDAALDGAAEPPEPWTGWVEQVHDDAERAAAAAELLEHPGAEAETLAPGSEATASYADGTFSFGIPAGEKGDPGEDGDSPSASVVKTGKTAVITITDKDGTTTASVSDGEDGEPGQDGFSPSASVNKSGSVATITVTDKNGTTTAQVSDGQNGQDGHDGADGYSPTAGVSKTGDTATITITDKNGTTTASVSDGQDGQPGYTPVRGTDYWTETDKTEIISSTKEEIEPELSALKSEIDGKAPAIFRDASGNIVSFADGADGMPLSAVVQISPVQSGTGDPSPSNVRPITGWTGANVVRTGRNMVKAKTPSREYQGVTYTKNDDGTVTLSGTASTDVNSYYSANWSYTSANAEYFTYLREGTYTLTGGVSSNIRLYFVCKKADDPSVSFLSTQDTGSGATFTLPYPCYCYLQIIAYAGTETNLTIKPMLVRGSTAAGYEPYVGSVYPISWQTAAGTVYGGNLDTKTGVLTVDKKLAVYDGSNDENWSYTEVATGSLFRINQSDRKSEIIALSAESRARYASNTYRVAAGTLIADRENETFSGSSTNVDFINNSYSTVDAFRAYLAQNPIQFLYALATPQIVQLSPVEIQTLLGENHIWSDTGAISVTYPADTQIYVDTLVQTATDPDGNVVQVSGSTPSITGESGKRYVCGTVDSISITPPGTGIIDVVFTSGTTPTVLTASGVVWPGWFDADNLDASTTYEINIMDGYGAVSKWT